MVTAVGTEELQQKSEFFKIDTVCWSCGIGLTIRAENIDYQEGVGEMKRDEFAYFAPCGRCLIVTRIPSGFIPLPIQEAAVERYRRHVHAPNATTHPSQHTVWFQLNSIWAMLRRKKVFVQLEPTGEGIGTIFHTFRP